MPRSVIKSKTIAVCGLCLTACEKLLGQYERNSVLSWREGQSALQESDH